MTVAAAATPGPRGAGLRLRRVRAPALPVVRKATAHVRVVCVVHVLCVACIV
jgi:hypothetical protein